MEISLLQRRASITGNVSSPTTSQNADGNPSPPATIPSNVATYGSPDTKQSEATTEEKIPSDGSNPVQNG